MRHCPETLDEAALYAAADALEAAAHRLLSDALRLRHTLERPRPYPHPAHLEKVTAATALATKASTLLRRLPS